MCIFVIITRLCKIQDSQRAKENAKDKNSDIKNEFKNVYPQSFYM